MSTHSEHSTYREKLLEHLFIGEVLRHLWSQGVSDAEFLRPEVDGGGYDLVIACNSIIRHIQLKSSHRGAKTARQKVNLRLQSAPSGCVVWMMYDEKALTLGPFLWFGDRPGKALPDISYKPLAKHSKGNAQGIKLERRNIRVLNRGDFERVATVSELVERLFGDVTSAEPMRQVPTDVLADIQDRFHELIRRRAAEFVDANEPVLPELASLLTSKDPKAWFAIPGMYGGFSYWLEGEGEHVKLVCESWSRVVEGSGQRHEITSSECNLVEDGMV